MPIFQQQKKLKCEKNKNKNQEKKCAYETVGHQRTNICIKKILKGEVRKAERITE